jgi:hypothetical protein
MRQGQENRFPYHYKIINRPQESGKPDYYPNLIPGKDYQWYSIEDL